MRRCKGVEEISFDRKLPLDGVKLRPRDQKNVFGALPKRQHFCSVYLELVLREYARDRVEQPEPVSGDHS